ncbi:hypothetical protein EV657_13914 [Rhodovulum visakhapatnamense]|uniref:Transposase n=1 Tax=Rhodovulum visakhapatnamense TaxID=364297 RepID=A0A4R8FF70_9RHOB|nr:hypothetical protein EV657_13914 [Rhodovulum visakhapatnamense]
MGTSNYSADFKRDAVHQIAVRGYPVREFPGVWASARILCTNG